MYPRFHVTLSVSFRLIDCVNIFLSLDTQLIIVSPLWQKSILLAISSFLRNTSPDPSPHMNCAFVSVNMEDSFCTPLWYQHLCVFKSLGDRLLGILVRDYFHWIDIERLVHGGYYHSLGLDLGLYKKEESEVNTSTNFYWWQMQCVQFPEAPACCGIRLLNQVLLPAAMWLACTSMMGYNLELWTKTITSSSKLLLSEYFITATGKETKTAPYIK